MISLTDTDANAGTRPLDVTALVQRVIEITRRQQRGITRLERESVAATTEALDQLIPSLRSAIGREEAVRTSVQEALTVVDTTLALLQALAQARQQLVLSLVALGKTAGITLDTEA